MLGIKNRSKKSTPESAPTIDYPTENEQIFPGHYAIRVSSSGPVEVSINEGPWEVCREANGYFWFDWWPEKSGKFKIAVRIAGKEAKKPIFRKGTVMAPQSN
jgi:hypothetical protein